DSFVVVSFFVELLSPSLLIEDLSSSSSSASLLSSSTASSDSSASSSDSSSSSFAYEVFSSLPTNSWEEESSSNPVGFCNDYPQAVKSNNIKVSRTKGNHLFICCIVTYSFCISRFNSNLYDEK